MRLVRPPDPTGKRLLSLAFFIHDLLPLEYPEYFPPATKRSSLGVYRLSTDRLQGENIRFADKTMAASAGAIFDPWDPWEYLASYSDLTNAFGANPQAEFDHYIDYGFIEDVPRTSSIRSNTLPPTETLSKPLASILRLQSSTMCSTGTTRDARPTSSIRSNILPPMKTSSKPLASISRLQSSIMSSAGTTRNVQRKSSIRSNIVSGVFSPSP
jgi:hypothetical protein